MYNENDYLEVHKNYLMHHGIKGQRWGIRRYQNPDGTLTEEGKARYYELITDSDKGIYDEAEKIYKKTHKIVESSQAEKQYAKKVITELKEHAALNKKFNELDKLEDNMSNLYKKNISQFYENINKEYNKYNMSLFKDKSNDNYIKSSDELKNNIIKTYNNFISDKNNYNALNNYNIYQKEYIKKADELSKLLLPENLKSYSENFSKNFNKILYDSKKEHRSIDYVNEFGESFLTYIKPGSIPSLDDIFAYYKLEQFLKHNKGGNQSMDGNTKIIDLLEDDEIIEHKVHEDGAIDKDFYDKIKSWTQHELNDLENRFYSRPWFGKAWQEYRSHVLNTKQKDIRNPGYVFKKYIADDEGISAEQKEYTYLSEDYMWYELRTEKERMKYCAHSIKIGKDYIEHSGVKGQKWGVRRYQNADGTLTPEGRARYGQQARDIARREDLPQRTSNRIVVKDEVARQIHTEVKSTQDIANGVSAVANQTANLIPNHTGKTVHGSYPNLSDQEIQSRINRLNLEQKYSDLKGDTSYIKSGKDKTREALQNIGIIASIGASIAGIALAINQMRNPAINTGGGRRGGH